MNRPDLFNALRMAFGFLTVLPVPQRKEWSDTDFGWSAVFYPLTGTVVGCCAGAAFSGLCRVFERPAAAFLTLIFWVLCSGGLHWDGLADCMDGFGCSASPERRLVIMKDPKLGTYGALGIFCALILKWLGLWHLPAGKSLLFFALIGATARWVMLFLLFMPLANPEGMAAMLKKNCPRLITLYAAPVPLVLAFFSGISGLFSLLLGLAAAGLLALLARVKIRGINGDVLGFCIELCEIILLISAQVLP